ncbi:MAG: methyltransferase domain-containing protein [Desulfobacterales bacterium]|nr:methyltransferase domain-containing protein [Desulfobacterales bacterium]
MSDSFADQLHKQSQIFSQLLNQKVDRSELAAVSQAKVDRSELAAVSQAKVDRSELAAVSQAKVDRSELAAVSQAKVDRSELTAVSQAKVDRSELAAVSQAKVDRSELAAVSQAKVDRSEFSDVVSRISRKADITQLDDLKVLKADRSELFAYSEKKADLSLLEQKADCSSVLEHKNRIDDILRQIVEQRRNLIDQERRLSILLEETRKRFPAPLDTDQVQIMIQEDERLLDQYYVSFEDSFRGSRQEIKRRQTIYLSDIDHLKIKTSQFPILDIGCGRGEWLELLKENGYSAIGIDINRRMVQECCDLGLTVEEADAISYLQCQQNGSFSVVTGFHIVEHLPLKQLIRLLDECLRVLCTGGMVIFETPNPENLLVGAYYFYMDLTHKNPITPDSFKFLIEHRGFVQIQIKRHNKYSCLFHLPEADAFTNKWFYSEMDYAAIGTKA